MEAKTSKVTRAVNPKTFNLWIFLVSIVMIFAALTSAFIVGNAAQRDKWTGESLPSLFIWSTIVIVISSVTMFWAQRSARKDDIQQLKTSLLITAILGCIFCVMQYLGWSDLVQNNRYFVGGKTSDSFLYVFTGLHGLHIISAIIAVFSTYYSAMKLRVHSQHMTGINNCGSYWHFLGLLWIYLYAFMLYYN